MKRTAENQLTKDSMESEDDIEEGKNGFQKADADSLATRKIRALPKRTPSTAAAGLSSQLTNTDSTPIGGSRFGGFSGFGATSSNKDDLKGSFPSFIGFGPTKAPSVSANVSKIRKFILSFTSLFTLIYFYIAAPNSGPPPSLTFQNVSTSTASDTDDNAPKPSTPTPNPTLTKYYTDLRGLNVSFTRAVSEAVEANPLVDLSAITEKYRTYRESIQKERDSNDAKQTPKLATLTSSSTPSTTAPAPAFTAPTFPSTTSFTFGSSSNLNPAPQTTASASSMSWSKLPSSSTDKASTPSFSFGSSSQTSSSGAFLFGGSSTEGAFGTKAAAATTTATTADSDKSSGSSTTQNLFKLQSTTPITPGFSSFLTPSSSLTATSNPQQPSTSTSTSITSEPSSSSTGNLFGAVNKGNMGNPLGFSFGNTPKFAAFPFSTTSTTTASTPGTETTSGNGLLDVPTKDEVSTEGDESASENAQTDNNKENQYDKDGAGEEDEETQFETKSKAYMNVTGADGKKAWSPVGTGQLKLKKQKEGTKRRLLMRNSSNGKVIINALLVPNFKLTVEGKTISFIVPNAEGTADFWKLRLSTESDAKAWEAKISEK